jgi:hypothetical protein
MAASSFLPEQQQGSLFGSPNINPFGAYGTASPARPAFPVASPQPIIPAPILAKPKATWYKQRWVLLVIVIVAVLLVMAFMGRKRFLGARKNKFSDKIDAVKNADRQADLLEWSLLWSKARRPNVKAVLEQVVTSELTPPVPSATPPPPPPPPAATDTTTATDGSAAASDPAFTVA